MGAVGLGGAALGALSLLLGAQGLQGSEHDPGQSPKTRDLSPLVIDPSWEHPVTVERQGCGILPGCLAKGWRFTKLVVWEESGPWKHGAWVLDSAQPLSRVFDRWENGGEVVTNNYSHPSCSNWLPKVPRPLQFSLFYVFPMRTFFAGVDWIGLLLFIPINTVVLNWVQFCFLEDIWL